MAILSTPASWRTSACTTTLLLASGLVLALVVLPQPALGGRAADDGVNLPEPASPVTPIASVPATAAAVSGIDDEAAFKAVTIVVAAAADIAKAEDAEGTAAARVNAPMKPGMPVPLGLGLQSSAAAPSAGGALGRRALLEQTPRITRTVTVKTTRVNYNTKTTVG